MTSIEVRLGPDAVGRPLRRLTRTAAAVLVMLPAVPAATAGPLTAAAPACGTARWAVKTGADADAREIDLSRARSTSVARLGALPVPAPAAGRARTTPVERTVFAVTAVLTRYKVEDDHDDHLVLRDPTSGAVMVAELPDPACVGRSSPLLPGITASRAAFDAAFSATTTWRSTSTRVSLRGVGFFDDDHGQTGVAANGVELHPVLRFTVVPPPAHAAPRPSARRTATALGL